MRIAFLTPLNPTRSGVSDYSEDLLPELGKLCEIDVFTDDGVEIGNASIARAFRCYGYGDYASAVRERQYDVAALQIACSGHHIPVYEILLRWGRSRDKGPPLIVVLHDLNVSGIIGAMTLERGDKIGFFRELLRIEGVSAFIGASMRFLATRRFPEWTTYPMNRLVIQRSDGIIVHNEYMRDAVHRVVRAARSSIPVWKVPMGVPLQPGVVDMDPVAAKRALGLEGYDLVVSSVGIVDERKRISVALGAFARLLEVVPRAVYLFVGPIAEEYRTRIEALGLGDAVRVLGRVDTERFYQYIAASDFCVNLRHPAIGETSAALLRLMSMGKPVAITNYAQFKEYPDDCCVKIDLGTGEEDTLLAQMERMAVDPGYRRRIGENAQRYVLEHHTLEQAARGYYEALVNVAPAAQNLGKQMGRI